jgi:hypothetical protein
MSERFAISYAVAGLASARLFASRSDAVALGVPARPNA